MNASVRGRLEWDMSLIGAPTTWCLYFHQNFNHFPSLATPLQPHSLELIRNTLYSSLIWHKSRHGDTKQDAPSRKSVRRVVMENRWQGLGISKSGKGLNSSPLPNLEQKECPSWSSNFRVSNPFSCPLFRRLLLCLSSGRKETEVCSVVVL